MIAIIGIFSAINVPAMTQITFDQLLDAVEHLPTDEQAALMQIVSRRFAGKGRKRVVDEVEQAAREYTNGACPTTSVDEIMRDMYQLRI
jgi:hypothetical protein